MIYMGAASGLVASKSNLDIPGYRRAKTTTRRLSVICPWDAVLFPAPGPYSKPRTGELG